MSGSLRARCPGAPLHHPLLKTGSVGLASPLPSTRSRLLGARRRLHAHLAGPPTSWHGFASPSRRSRSRSAVVVARAHQLARPPSFYSLVAGEKWDHERGIWELGFCPSPRSALHPVRGRLEPSIRSDGSDLPSVGPSLPLIMLRPMGRGSASDRPRICGSRLAAQLVGRQIDSTRQRWASPSLGRLGKTWAESKFDQTM